MQFPDSDCTTINDVNTLSMAEQHCQFVLKNKPSTVDPFPLSYRLVLETRHPDLLRKDRWANAVYTPYVKSLISNLVTDNPLSRNEYAKADAASTHTTASHQKSTMSAERNTFNFKEYPFLGSPDHFLDGVESKSTDNTLDQTI